MRDSADSGDYGVTRPGRRGNNKKRGKFYDDEAGYEKRNRHQPRLAPERGRLSVALESIRAWLGCGPRWLVSGTRYSRCPLVA